MAMARSDERTPLLLEIESVDSYDLKSVPDTFLPSKADSVSINENDLKLVAVFVATFDTRHGVFDNDFNVGHFTYIKTQVTRWSGLARRIWI